MIIIIIIIIIIKLKGLFTVYVPISSPDSTLSVFPSLPPFPTQQPAARLCQQHPDSNRLLVAPP